MSQDESEDKRMFVDCEVVYDSIGVTYFLLPSARFVPTLNPYASPIAPSPEVQWMLFERGGPCRTGVSARHGFTRCAKGS